MSALTPQRGGLDWWVQRVTVAAMLALAIGLVALGVAFYAPRANATAPVSSLLNEGKQP